MSRIRRKGKVVPGHPRLSVVRQCKLLGLSRSSVYYRPVGESKRNLDLMRQIDEQFLETPWYGSRLMCSHLRREGHAVGRKRIRRLMRKMGLAAIYQRPNTSAPHPEHRIYPYLLKGMEITEPGKVWCADITYIPMRRGFLYLVVVMDWYSRKVLSWRLSNSLDADFCVEALQEALARFRVWLLGWYFAVSAVALLGFGGAAYLVFEGRLLDQTDQIGLAALATVHAVGINHVVAMRLRFEDRADQ